MKRENPFVLGPTALGRLFKQSRAWARKRLKEWERDQAKGGPIRVWKKPGGALYTTMAVVDLYMPRARRDPVLERRLKELETGIDLAFRRIADLERKLGVRR